jgi:hypothetical protein
MIHAHLACFFAALFAGAAIYVAAVEHPARLLLDDGAALGQWKPSYARGKIMQAALALLGGAAALWAWWLARDPLLLAGGVLLLANWPFTLLAILPTNHRLEAIDPAAPAPETRALLVRWGRLHLVRAALGAAAALALFLALVIDPAGARPAARAMDDCCRAEGRR